MRIFLLVLFAAVLGCGKSPLDARKELAGLGFAYTKENFFAAARDGDLTAVKLFVEAGMPVNIRGGSYVWTALIFAAHGGHLEVVKYLVKEGADVNATGRFGGTAWSWAAENDHWAAARYLESVGG